MNPRYGAGPTGEDAQSADPPSSRAAALAGWASLLRAGGAAGAVCGLVDAVIANAGTSAHARTASLAVFGVGAGLVVGVSLGAVFVLARGLVALLLRSRLPAVLGAVLLAAPLIVYDAFAMFSGAQARKLPGGPLLPFVATAVGLIVVAGMARLTAGIAQRLTDAPAATGAPLVARVALGLVGTALAAGAFVANRVVLPRLYPWFHATLALSVLVIATVTVWLVVAAGRSVLPAASRRRTVLRVALNVGALVAGLVAAGVGWRQVTASQLQRFVIHQKSQLLGYVLRVATPSTQVTQPRGQDLRRAREDLPPLPEGPRRPDADVILITIDALRPDHMGVYGYRRNTTPNLDALAKRSVRFERAYTQAPNTSFASTTILTGKYYPTLARLGPPDGLDSLPLLLRRYGLKTAAFYPPAVFYIAPDKLKAYVDSNFHFEYVKIEFLPAPDRLGQIQAFFAAERPARAFLWLHLFEPHETYERHPGHDFGGTDVDRYDSEIAFVDRALGDLLAFLQRERPRAIVIVTADHGEEFDEHGGRYHGATLYEEQVRVPLLIFVPGVVPRVIRGPVELVDLAPTILALLDIPIPLRMRGHDLGPWLRDPPAPVDRLSPAFAEVNDLRMVATDNEKLICDDQKGFCELFDLSVDAREQHNLAEARPDRVAALRAELDAWLADNAALEGGRGEQGQGDGRFPRAIERARMGDVAVAKDVATLLASPDTRVAQEAARLLATSLPPQTETRAALTAAAAAPDPLVARWALIGAARAGDEAALTKLAAEMNRPASAATPPGAPSSDEIFAALALADHGNAVAVTTLVRGVKACSDPPLCMRLVNALGDLRDPGATAALVDRLPTVLGRREVVTALGRIGDKAAVSPLIERLDQDEYTPVRVAAAAALADIGGRAARDALATAARKEREPTVIAAIQAARAKLRGPRSAPR